MNELRRKYIEMKSREKQQQNVLIDVLIPFSEISKNIEVDSLVDSIKENGVLTPILIRPNGNGMYEIISGHRRTRAAALAGLTEIPAYVQQMTDEEASIYAMFDNLSEVN